MSTTMLERPCFVCGGPAEHIDLAFIGVRLFEPEQTINGAAVCARCFVESEDR